VSNGQFGGPEKAPSGKLYLPPEAGFFEAWAAGKTTVVSQKWQT
jgi:hypothetical protein